jgi:hypothetical protein
MSFLDALIPGSRRHDLFVRSIDTLDSKVADLEVEQITIDGHTLGHFYAPPAQFFQLTSPFFNGTVSVRARILGFEQMFTIMTSQFQIVCNGTDGAFTGSVPDVLEPYDMTGELVYTSTVSPGNKRIAFVTKPENAATLRIEPQNDTFFSGPGFAGQTLTFRAGRLSCALRQYS